MQRKGIYSAMKKKMIPHIFKHSAVVEWQTHTHTQTNKKHTFPPVAPPAGEYGSIHDDATHQLYLIYNIAKVRSELSWDILVDIPDKTDCLMGVCVTSRGTSESMELWGIISSATRRISPRSVSEGQIAIKSSV